jgi:flagellum-specific peptidoglycan hydrolase FlgJ
VLTATVSLLSPPRAKLDAFEHYMLARKHGAYTDADVRAILRRYDRTATEVGLDPLLIVSQLVLETRNLDSFWSQRPRRNPAGIGVTGQPGVGISFPSWDKAVRAHVGRLLAYAIRDDEANPGQLSLIKEALDVRPLPSNRRGCAPTVHGLAGTWAADTGYAEKIVRLANEIG